MAIIGINLASSLSIALINLVAVIPSSLGIITSMSMASYVPSLHIPNSSTACCPSETVLTKAPSSLRNVSIISWLSLLSSASKRRTPVISSASPVFFCAYPFIYSFSVFFCVISSSLLLFFTSCTSAVLNGILITNVVPLSFSLMVFTVPSILSISLFTIAIPSPVP